MNRVNKLKRYWARKDDAKEYFKWIIDYTKPYIPQLGLLLSFDLIATLLSVGMAIIGKTMIDNASEGNLSELASIITIYVLVIVGGQSLAIISNLVSTVVYEKFGFGIRKKVYRRILDTCWLDISKYHTGDLMTRLTSDVSAVSDGISSTIPTIIRLVVELLVTFFTLAYYDVRLALFALLVAPITMIASFWLGKKIKYLQVKVQESESKYRSFMQESLANILIEKSFCLEDYSEEKLTKLRDERIYWVFKKNRTNMYASAAMGLSFQIGYIVAFAWGAICIANKTITFGTMTIFLQLVNRIQSPIVGLAQVVPRLISMLASAGRIIEIQDLPKEEYKGLTIRNENVGVKISHVSFGYSDELVFDDASIEIKPGEVVALVGRSGIGKTTLVRLIMAFTKNMKGSIAFYNSYGEEIDSSPDARHFIAYVPQGNTLFSGTIRENILIGREDATEDEIIAALDSAAALDFVNELQNGIDTVIGEKGVGISEGQAQRLSIARALIRNAPFLILDEATSSLDEATELRVLDGIRNWDPAPTCLVITHRKSILKYCNREIQIADKKMREAI
ncbi:ABC-type multidrug transport system, ATPase and permease component [Butyrivibrio sp. Su6]|uniref:ABC transporter ATP-binding protein n=1 Tax=Butyrivibrio sp. Su6 TaxID=1520810 RepID=UPI00089E1072|nr:ABC transporter ATP-binding protein [Butyrivibrio sp. Su6]SEG25795.1 ABC-type multidrug transport system, ATPase and permease component [Butyrivibrio sp. Su6]